MIFKKILINIFLKNIFDWFESGIRILLLSTDTKYRVHGFVQLFHRVHCSLKLTSKKFQTCFFWVKKEEKNVENFFLIRSSYFSKLIKETETIPFREKQRECRLHFDWQSFHHQV